MQCSVADSILHNLFDKHDSVLEYTITASKLFNRIRNLLFVVVLLKIVILLSKSNNNYHYK